MRSHLIKLSIIFTIYLIPISIQAADFSAPTLQVDIPNISFTKKVTCQEGQECSMPWIKEYVTAIYKYAIGIAGILATLVLMFGGVLWLTAGGNAGQVQEATAWIGASLTGLIIALSSYVILYQVNPSLVSFSSTTLTAIKAEEKQPVVYTSGGGEKGTDNIAASPNKNTWNGKIMKESALYNVDDDLIKAVVFAESGGDQYAKSSAGALGLMQLMPATAAGLGYADTDELLNNPDYNIAAGTKYLQELLATACNGKSTNATCTTSDLRYVIAAYNGGPKANTPSVDCPGQTYWECNKNAGYAQTRAYVNKVMNNLNAIKSKKV